MYEENNHSEKNDGASSAEITYCDIYSPTYAHRLFKLGKVEKSFEQKPRYMHFCCEQLIRSSPIKAATPCVRTIIYPPVQPCARWIDCGGGVW